MELRRISRVALAALPFALIIASAEAAPSSDRDQCSPPASRVFTTEFGSGSNQEVEVYSVPAGTTFVVTDIIALRDGNADGLLRLFAGEKLMATVPLVGLVSHSDLYGVHLVTGIPFSGGQAIRLKKTERGAAWVTIVGLESAPPQPSSQ